MKCFFCSKATEEGIIRCDDCKDAKNTATISFRGEDWASCSNTERVKRWNQNQSAENRKKDLSSVGMI